MKRTVVEINPAACNGCGVCLLSCEEGALEIIDSKAVLAHEFACDGIGSCAADCPQNAITMVLKECDPCDINAIMTNICSRGTAHISSYLRHLERHSLNHLRDKAFEYLRAHDIPIPDYKLEKR